MRAASSSREGGGDRDGRKTAEVCSVGGDVPSNCVRIVDTSNVTKSDGAGIGAASSCSHRSSSL